MDMSCTDHFQDFADIDVIRVGDTCHASASTVHYSPCEQQDVLLAGPDRLCPDVRLHRHRRRGAVEQADDDQRSLLRRGAARRQRRLPVCGVREHHHQRGPALARRPHPGARAAGVHDTVECRPPEGRPLLQDQRAVLHLPDPPRERPVILTSSSDPFGPYTMRQVLLDLSGPIPGGGVPHQDGLVQTQSGAWYYWPSSTRTQAAGCQSWLPPPGPRAAGPSCNSPMARGAPRMPARPCPLHPARSLPWSASTPQTARSSGRGGSGTTTRTTPSGRSATEPRRFLDAPGRVREQPVRTGQQRRLSLRVLDPGHQPRRDDPSRPRPDTPPMSARPAHPDQLDLLTDRAVGSTSGGSAPHAHADLLTHPCQKAEVLSCAADFSP